MGILDFFLLAFVGVCTMLAVSAWRKVKESGGGCGNCSSCHGCSNAK